MPREGRTRHRPIRHPKEKKKRRLKHKGVATVQNSASAQPCLVGSCSATAPGKAVSSNWKTLAKVGRAKIKIGP